MRMIDDDQVIFARQFLDRERIRNPAASACPSRCSTPVFSFQSRRAGDHRVVAARMAPGHALQLDALTGRTPRGCLAVFADARRGAVELCPLAIDAERRARREDRDIVLALTVCSMSSTLKPSLSSSSVPVQHLGAPDVGRLENGEPVRRWFSSRCCSAMIA